MKFAFSRCFLVIVFILMASLFLLQPVHAQALSIPDPNLKQIIREALKLPDEIPLTQPEMQRLRTLDAGGDIGITDLTGLEYATNLQSLGLYHNPIVDISPLAHLTKLAGFNLWGCRVVDLGPLRDLKNLSWILLGNNQISDISPLSELTNLTVLDIAGNRIMEIGSLANLIQLEELRLNGNAITDIAPLIGLKNLKKLRIGDNPFHDFSPLFELEGVELDIEIGEGFDTVVEIPDPNLRLLIREALSLPDAVPLTQGQMRRLTKLDAGGDRGITDLTGLEYATNLQSLELYHNPIVDINPLAHLTKLAGFNLWGCRIVDLSPLRDLKNLSWILLGNNQISDISPLSELTNLTVLDIAGNRIMEIGSLANLIQLEELRLNGNAITDIAPLIGLKNLKKLRIGDNPFHDFGPLFELEGVELDIEIGEGFDTVVEIPDPNLRQLIREALVLPDAVPLTQGQVQRLTRLDSDGDRGIVDLTGLEYATNLRSLSLYDNPIVDISPFSQLAKLEGLNLWGCRIVDLSPLRNLKNLRWLGLGNNQISDISSLAELISLTDLHLSGNKIVDFSPLANLVNLEELLIYHNFATDISPLQELNLTEFRYDEVCDIEPRPPLVRERLANRSFPSVFQAWNDVIGLDRLTREQRHALHDLYWSPHFRLEWSTAPTKSTHGTATSFAGDLVGSREVRQRWLDLNPNMLFLRHIWLQFHSIRPDSQSFPPDSDFWLRDAQGKKVINSYNEYVIKFYEPEVQELLIQRIVDIDRCGLYDGVFLDGIGDDGAKFVDRDLFPVTDEEIRQAMLNIFRAVRSQVREDFLILVNTNRLKATQFAEYVNGTFMETLTDSHFSDNPGAGGYTHGGLYEIEDTLAWSEENLRSPQINCLEGWGIPTEPPDSPDNRRWMRVFTTMSLTHSDGYVLYTTGTGIYRLPNPGDDYPWEPSHAHIWYPFWDADLGRPVGPKAQRYQDIPGLFIREFTNGWAVYNRSGATQAISLVEDTAGVASGGIGRTHQLADLDGEIYLKVKNPADVNGDGKIDILDLVQVANGLGKSAPDVNSDGAVNILDLVFVANRLDE